MVWRSGESFITYGVSFVVGIILARILNPADFGLIAMVEVFTVIASRFADSGFTNALIRKNNRKDIDYSTVYVTNVVISTVFALILFFVATPIANFYNQPLLQKIVRFNALMVFLGSFLAVQSARLTIQLDFKTRGIINVVAATITGIVSIVLAFLGYGVWALVYPAFFTLLAKAVLFWRYQRWFPGFKFSWKIWREFFSFGSKLLLSDLLNTVYGYIYPLVIGKKFSATDLGYYTKADSYAGLPSTVSTSVLSNVTFPVLARIQDDDTALQSVYRRLISLSAFVIFPILMGICALAKPFVICLLTEKWSESVIYLQILCFALMWYPVHALNLNLLQVKGRSDLFLRLEVIKKILGVAILIVSIPFGLVYMCAGRVLSSVICLVINTHYTGKLIHVGFFKQMKDVAPSLLYSLAMGLSVWFLIQWIPNLRIQLFAGIPAGLAFYYGIAKLTKSPELAYMMQLLQENFLRNGKQ